jgi:hypothetical protein
MDGNVRLLDPAQDRESAWKFLEIVDFQVANQTPNQLEDIIVSNCNTAYL